MLNKKFNFFHLTPSETAVYLQQNENTRRKIVTEAWQFRLEK